ncbi:SMC-Scp complex subunit ScpB [Geomonas paludis]|uniref:SMC-Scp complex subunit ScpB n=1 Tax=Geomonas paludis TaxID=2740185 RepID=A0A6V8MUM7_9BACT|nr:SMC-Scp complex subunit ScpB [Geomonas paludis]UPU38055.1 SMC-Scp complex subunit ScpB [Geomonas paludis]GFO63417.1 segregation and condensation protein B [Geomonas paludis]
MSGKSLKGIVESILFVHDQPLTLDRLAGILEEYDRADLRAALDELIQDYETAERGIVLIQVAGGYQLRSRPEHGDYIRRLNKTKGVKFSQSALETLAIVAYRQPITRAEVEYLRGVDSGGVMKSLLEKKLLRIMGKKDVPGKPLIYGTSREFLELFGLKDLNQLPTLKEIQELVPPDPFADQPALPLGSGVATDSAPAADSVETDASLESVDSIDSLEPVEG